MSKDNKDKKRKKRKAEKQKQKRKTVKPSKTTEHKAYAESTGPDGELVQLEIQGAAVDMITIDPMKDTRQYSCCGDENFIGIFRLNTAAGEIVLGLSLSVVDQLIDDLQKAKQVNAGFFPRPGPHLT